MLNRYFRLFGRAAFLLVLLSLNEAVRHLFDAIERVLLEHFQILYLLVENLEIVGVVLYLFSEDHFLQIRIIVGIGLLLSHDSDYFCFGAVFVAHLALDVLRSLDAHEDGRVLLDLVLVFGVFG